MARRRCDWYMEVLPFIAMVGIDSICVGLYTLHKAATLRGLSHRVFLVYAHVVSALVLLPAPFMSYRSRAIPPLSLAILAKIDLLGLIGMEKVSLKRSSSQAKIIGTVLSISGAFVVTLYKGPPIITIALKWPVSIDPRLSMSSSNWVPGGIFLMAENILIPCTTSFWYPLCYYTTLIFPSAGEITQDNPNECQNMNMQAQIREDYPAELSVTFFRNVFAGFITAIVALVAEHDTNAWRESDIGLASVICSGLFAHCLHNCLHTWAIRMKGPLYVAMFKPVSIVIADVMGFIFLGDALHLGRY